MKFLLTEKLAIEFLTEYVKKLNLVYKNYVQTGFYNKSFYNFNLKSGNRFLNIDYYFDEYLPNKYLFFSICFKVKFLTASVDDTAQDIAVCLPLNAINFLDIKIDDLPNLPDIKKFFVKFFYKIFGVEYKIAVKNYIKTQENNQNLIVQENQRFLQQKIDYNNSLLEELNKIP